MFCFELQCPEKEPDIALYLRVCNLCQEKISNKQIIENNATEDASQEGGDNLVRLEALHNSSVKLEQKTDTQLAQVNQTEIIIIIIYNFHLLISLSVSLSYSVITSFKKSNAAYLKRNCH